MTVAAPPRGAERARSPAIPLIRRDSEYPALFAELMAAVERVT
jgi:hypothetical protein